MGSIQYITIEEVLAIHATVLGLTNGTLGVRDMNSLQGCLERPKTTLVGKEMFAEIFSKAAALIESVARNHAFVDGNKRTSYLIGAYFLFQNGYVLSPEHGEIETYMLWIVLEKPDIEHMAAWLQERSISA